MDTDEGSVTGKDEIEDVRMVWVFVGDTARLPSAVFSTLERAQAWIARHRISGLVTQYPLDVPVIDWAVAQGVYSPKPGDEHDTWKIQTFTSAAQRHYHYVDGSSNPSRSPGDH